MNKSIKSQLAVNTITNYVYFLSHIITTIYLTRVIYLNLDNNTYGFWQLMWVVFGFSVLLDFGFGVTIQKYAAEYNYNKDIKALNETFSLAMANYLIMALIVATMTFIAAFYLDSIFTFEESVGPKKIDEFKNAFIVFGLGMALIFPTGVFSEILHGLGRLDLKNYVRLGERLIYTAGVYFVFEMDWSLIELVSFSVLVNLLLNLTMALIVLKKVPGLKLNLFKHDIKKLKTVGTFSLFVYLISLSNVLIMKTDHFILGVSVGMTSVAAFHIGSRLGKLLLMVSTRFQESLSPIAALLHHKGETARLKHIMLQSNRITVYITTGFFIVLIMLLKPILYIWLEVADDNQKIYEVAFIVMTSVYIHSVTRSTSDKFFLMTGKHRVLAVISIFEAIVNVILSLILVRLWGVTGVAVGTLVPNLIVSLFVFYPMTCTFVKIKKIDFFRKVFYPVFITTLPALAVLWIMTHLIFPVTDLSNWNGWTGVLKLAASTAAAGGVYVTSGYFLTLTAGDKRKLKLIFARKKPIPERYDQDKPADQPDQF